MKLNQKITLTLGLLAAGTVGYAQPSSAPAVAPTAPSGLLGQQYTEVSFGLQDIKGVDAYGQTLFVGANTPYLPGKLDAGGGYSYSWIGGANNGHANTVTGYARAYAPMKGVKPFVTAGLGWAWTNTRFGGSVDKGLWGSAVGVEIPVGTLTVTPKINYGDDFEGSKTSVQAWTYSVEANCWLNSRTAVFASIGYVDVNHSSTESWSYVIGLRGKF